MGEIDDRAVAFAKAEHALGRRYESIATALGVKAETLSALVTEEMHREALSGDLFVLISKDRKRIKVLHFDGTGLIVWAKRLEDGRFASLYHKKRDGGLELSPSECARLLKEASAWGDTD